MIRLLHAKCHNCLKVYLELSVEEQVTVEDLSFKGWSTVFPNLNAPPIVYCPQCSVFLRISKVPPIVP